MRKKILLFAFTILAIGAKSQIITSEDSLSAGLLRNSSSTIISGYGQAKVDYDMRLGTGVASLTRNVLFIGHKFNEKFSLFSEMEIENAKVESGASGEVAMEQLFLKINLNREMYLVTGLFVPRIGIINENHLPNTFNGNDRHYIESLIIPSTWRELGVSLYGQTRMIPGLNYTLSLMNGLNAAGFEYGSGIRGGRQEGSFASASNIALSASLLYYYNNFRIQLSGYYGGSCGLPKQVADSLKLNNGALGNPVSLIESNVQYRNKGWQFKALAVVVNVDDAKAINAAYANNMATQMYGYMAEAGYNLMYAFNKNTKQNLTIFSRYEVANLNYKLPDNAVSDEFLKKEFLVTGLTYQPIRSIAFKIDYVHRSTGDYNKTLYPSNPYSTVLPFYKNNSNLNIGIAYSF